MPWKNGSGETREIAVVPPDASFEALDWRISLATVASDGPFSVFAGVERTLCLIRGAGLHLKVGNEPPDLLTVESEPRRFRGDVPTYASLVNGPVVDINVMTRKGRAEHRVRREQIAGHSSVSSEAGVLILFCQSGLLRTGTTSHTYELGCEDCLMIERPTDPLQLLCPRAAQMIVIEIFADIDGADRCVANMQEGVAKPGGGEILG
jgi:uncharacterized protein